MTSKKHKVQQPGSGGKKTNAAGKREASSLLLMLVVLTCFYIFSIGFAEKILVNGGFGWDGLLYGEIIKHFDDYVFHKKLMEFTIGRMLPLTIIHHFMQAFHIALSNHNIVLLFQIYNAVLVIFSVLLWTKIAKHLKLSNLCNWIGFFALFINFANLKMLIYYPVSTDPTTVFLGCLLLYLFLKNNFWGLLLVCVFGAFVQQTMIFFGLPLFIFKIQEIEFEKSRYKLNYLIAGLLCLVILFGIIRTNWMIDFTLPSDSLAPIYSLIPFSAIFLVTLLFILFSKLFDNHNTYQISNLIKSTVVYRLMIALVLYFSIQSIYRHFGIPNFELYSFSFYLKALSKLCVTKPFITIISFVIWFGPFLFLTIMKWRDFTKEIYRYGYGLFFMLTLGVLILFMGSESRHATVVYPFLCAFTLKVINNKKINHYFLGAFALLSILFSKIWFSINPLPLDSGNAWEFPMQKYFMNFGPWMSNQAYAVQGAVVLSSFIILFLFFNKLNSGGLQTPTNKVIPR